MSALLRFFAAGRDAPLIEDRQRVDRLYRFHRIGIMLAITAGYGLGYTCRLGLSVVKKPLIDGGYFSAAELGTIGSAIFYSYAFGKLVNGFLADHANIRRFLSFGILMSAVINLLIVRSTVLWIWIVLWGLNGWFQGFGAPGGVVAMSHWFSNRERGRYYGIWSTAHSLGEGLTFIGSSTLVACFGWRGAFTGPGLICIAVAFLMFLVLRDRPRTLGLPAVADWTGDHSGAGKAGSDQESVWRLQLSVMKEPAIWILALASASMYVTRYGMSSWGILYLQEAKGFSGMEAGGMLALNTLAGLAGCVIFGFASDKFFQAKRPPMNLICGLVEIASLVLMFFTPVGHPALLTLAFLLYGLSINGLITSLGGLFAVDIAPKRASGAAMGFIGVFSYLAAATEERVSGTLIQHGTTLVGGVRHYNFHAAVAFWLGSSVLSLVLASSLWWAKVRS